MQLYVCMCVRVCVARSDYVYAHSHREMRGTENCEFGLWIAREWPRGSRHMLADEFSEPLNCHERRRRRLVHMILSRQQHFRLEILHNRPRLSSLKYMHTHIILSRWFMSSVPRVRRSPCQSRIRDSTNLESKEYSFRFFLANQFFLFILCLSENMSFLHQLISMLIKQQIISEEEMSYQKRHVQ